MDPRKHCYSGDAAVGRGGREDGDGDFGMETDER